LVQGELLLPKKIERNLMQKREDRLLYSLIVENKEFYVFLKKFLGSFISRGNRSRAVKMYDEIFYIIKQKLRKDPIKILYSVFTKLVPLFSIAYKRIGNRYQPVPKFASKSARTVIIVD
jgi:ribosomal protein S7